MIDVILKIMTQMIISDYSSLEYQKDEAKNIRKLLPESSILIPIYLFAFAFSKLLLP